MNPRRIAADFGVFARGYVRNRVGLFFALAFPVIIILLFGAIYTTAGSSTAPVVVQDLDPGGASSQQFLAILNASHDLSLSFVNASVGNLSSYLTSRGLTAGLVIPANFSARIAANQSAGVVVYTDPGQASVAGTVQGVVSASLVELNLERTHTPSLAYPIARNVGSPIFTDIDYLVPGLIGFTILTSPMFAMVELTATYRKEKLFRQLSLTPLTRGEWLSSKILWYVVLTLISAALMVSVGDLLFSAHARLSWGMLPFLVLGTFLFVSLGMLSGSVTRTPETAAVVGNAITFPMMFLSGTFFPVQEFSPALQAVAKVLPLYYVIDGLNSVMLFNDPTRALTDALVVLGISLVFFLAALRAFRWRDE